MLAALVALSLTAPAVEPPKELSEAAQQELKKFAGKWKVVSLVADGGERHSESEGEASIFEVKGHKFILGEMELLGVEALDPGTNPKCVDLKGLGESGVVRKGVVYEGVYKLDGDTLTLAVNFGKEKNRPEKFESPK